jgi:bacillithiol system protein YtxJ
MWKNLEDLKQLDQIIEDSKSKEIAIFKHSTRCGISSMVKRSFETELKSKTDLKSDVYYLDLIQFREISNHIASKFDIAHQSPQLIIIKNGLATYNASHNSITAEKIN